MGAAFLDFPDRAEDAEGLMSPPFCRGPAQSVSGEALGAFCLSVSSSAADSAGR